MKTLTLWQLWATLLVIGFKKVETRSWSASPRLKLPTKILIHAAARPLVQQEMDMIYANISPEMGLSLALIKQYPLSSIIGMVTIKSSLLMTTDSIASESQAEKAFGLWQPGRWAWRCTNPVKFDNPIECRGRQLFGNPKRQNCKLLNLIR